MEESPRRTRFEGASWGYVTRSTDSRSPSRICALKRFCTSRSSIFQTKLGVNSACVTLVSGLDMDQDTKADADSTSDTRLPT